MRAQIARGIAFREYCWRTKENDIYVQVPIEHSLLVPCAHSAQPGSPGTFGGFHKGVVINGRDWVE